MLILTRKAGESIAIGDDVKIHILGIKGGQVRIGVEAPREVPVNRVEIFQRQDQQGEEEKGQQESS